MVHAASRSEHEPRKRSDVPNRCNARDCDRIAGNGLREPAVADERTVTGAMADTASTRLGQAVAPAAVANAGETGILALPILMTRSPPACCWRAPQNDRSMSSTSYGIATRSASRHRARDPLDPAFERRPAVGPADRLVAVADPVRPRTGWSRARPEPVQTLVGNGGN